MKCCKSGKPCYSILTLADKKNSSWLALLVIAVFLCVIGVVLWSAAGGIVNYPPNGSK